MSTVAAAVVVVAVGAVLAYLGFQLAGFGVVALSGGESLVGVLSLALGIALILAPVAVLVSQVRSMLRRRG